MNIQVAGAAFPPFSGRVKLQTKLAKAPSVDWVALRRAFVERPERPLVDDLAKEFGLSPERIYRASRDEGWPTMRAALADERLKQADAAMALVNMLFQSV